MKWFKFYGQDYLSDPKMLSLTANERSCWITLLSYASVNDNGMITFMSEHLLMIQSGIDVRDENWNETAGVLKKFQDLKMIRIDNDMITVLNWEKRQETNLTSYERVKRYREKKRNDTKMITIEENRIEENRIEEKNKGVKGGKKKEPSVLPDWLDKGKWSEWLAYRRQSNRTTAPVTITKQLNLLGAHKDDHVEIIENSIANGWAGLFPLKGKRQSLPTGTPYTKGKYSDKKGEIV